jgi:hypothetical protein
MPTIKLKGGNVLIKNGKASCACCDAPETCCMYPADGLGDTYEVEDLPEAVVLTYIGNLGALPEANAVIFTRGGTPPVYYIATIGEDEVAIAIDEGFNWYYEFEGERDGQPLGECLIFPADADGNFVEDQFADCYEVEFAAENPSDSGTHTVIRRGLCVWSSEIEGSEPGGVVLVYDDVLCQWEIQMDNIYAKESQSSPEGEYNSGESRIATVTETTCP